MTKTPQITMLCFIGILFLSSPAVAQSTSGPFSVEVVGNSDDSVGSKLIYEIKNKIQQSALMQLKGDDPYRVAIFVSTLENDREYSGTATVYSVAWVAYDPAGDIWRSFMWSTVGICGANRVESCASGLVANTYEAIEELKKIRR